MVRMILATTFTVINYEKNFDWIATTYDMHKRIA